MRWLSKDPRDYQTQRSGGARRSHSNRPTTATPIVGHPPLRDAVVERGTIARVCASGPVVHVHVVIHRPAGAGVPHAPNVVIPRVARFGPGVPHPPIDTNAELRFWDFIVPMN